MVQISDIKSEPIYSEAGKLTGCRLYWTALTDYFEIDDMRFFKETLLRKSYRAMCRFQSKLLKRNGNENNK